MGEMNSVLAKQPNNPFMRLTTFLFIVALVLSVIGLFGVASFLVPMHPAARHEVPQAGSTTAEDASHEKQRQKIALIGYLAALLVGIGAGAWAHLRYLGSLPAEERAARQGKKGPHHDICSICGTRLTRRQQAQGICGHCQLKVG